MAKMKDLDAHLLLHCALRYCMPRKSYITGKWISFYSALKKNLTHVSKVKLRDELKHSIGITEGIDKEHWEEALALLEKDCKL